MEHDGGHNLTKVEDRWDWIEKDMLKHWTDIIKEDPEKARELAKTSFDDSPLKAWGDFAKNAYNEWTDEDE